MTDFNLTQSFQLFVSGASVGILISFFPFLIGYLIQSIYSIIKNHS